MVLAKRRQASRSSHVDTFELDVARDLLRGVTGDSMDPTFFKRLTGSDSICLTTDLPFSAFGDLLDELLAAYVEDKYKANFGWIDNVKEVDPAVRKELDELLVEALRHKETSGMHLAPADDVEWRSISGFTYTGGKKNLLYGELDLEDYVRDILAGRLKALTMDHLKRHKVRTRLEDSDFVIDQWPVYDCLVWETEFKGKRFVLFDGRWFEVEKAYAARVRNFLTSIAKISVPMPRWKVGEDEKSYNQSVADTDPKQFALLDRQTVRTDGVASPIEFCDLMSRTGHLIHVKKRSSSATLSHLFSQGSVSADAFLRDEGVRREIQSKLKTLHKEFHATRIPTARPNPGDFEVVYAILAKDTAPWPPDLPFFSAVNLMHHASRVQNMGFKVSLQHVRQS